MNPLTIITAVTAAISVVKQLIDLGKDVAPLVTKTYDVLVKGEDVTQAELDELRILSDSYSAEIQQPVPPEEE